MNRTHFISNQNQNNNALDNSFISHNLLLNECNSHLSRLRSCFISHSKTSIDNSDHQMTCSSFIQYVAQYKLLNTIDNRLQLNGIFNQIQSSLVNQGVYVPGSLTIDFHGFILCLQQVARIFHINLRVLIKSLISAYL